MLPNAHRSSVQTLTDHAAERRGTLRPGDHGISGQVTTDLAARYSYAVGPMLETFVLSELARQLSWNDERVTLFHYRTKDKVEVDAVLETADGRVVGVEVKASATVRSGPPTGPGRAGPRNLRRQAGARFVAGYVPYTGAQTPSFGDGLSAVPTRPRPPPRPAGLRRGGWRACAPPGSIAAPRHLVWPRSARRTGT